MTFIEGLRRSSMTSNCINLGLGYVILFLTMFVLEPLSPGQITLDYLIFWGVEAASALGGSSYTLVYLWATSENL